MSETKKIEFNQDAHKVAIESFNVWLKEKGKDEIVFEGLDESQQITNFLAPIMEAAENGEAGLLPTEVIEYYNTYFAEEEEEEEGEETETKEKTKKKTKKTKTPKEDDGKKPWQKPIGKEKLVYELVKQGKTDKEIRDIILEMYAGHPDPDFVEWRIYTYMVKGKNFIAKEDPKFAEKWAEQKKTMKTVPHPKKKKSPEELAEIEAKKAKIAAEKKAKKEAEKAKKKEEKKEAKKTEKPKKEKAPKKKTSEKETPKKKKSTKKGK
jgi:hypothetical protein